MCMWWGWWSLLSTESQEPNFRICLFSWYTLYRLLFLQGTLHYLQKNSFSRLNVRRPILLYLPKQWRQGVSYNIIDPTDCVMINFSHHKDRFNEIDSATKIMKQKCRRVFPTTKKVNISWFLYNIFSSIFRISWFNIENTSAFFSSFHTEYRNSGFKIRKV